MLYRLWERMAGVVSRFFKKINEARMTVVAQLQREIDEEQNRRR